MKHIHASAALFLAVTLFLAMSLFFVPSALSAQQSGRPVQPELPDQPETPVRPVQPAVPGGPDAADTFGAFDRSGLTGSRYRMSSIVAMPVILSAGDQDQQTAPGIVPRQRAGRVEDLIITGNGNVSHLLVNIREAVGFESRRYLVSSDRFILQNQNLILDIRQSPQSLIPADDEEQIRQYVAEDSVRAERLLGFDVIGSNEQVIGSIDDIVVDMEQGSVAYVALARGGVLGIGEALFAVPLDRLEVRNEQEQVRIDAAEQDFEDRKGFDPSDWPEEPE